MIVTKKNIFFSDFFGISSDILANENFYNISLTTDLPLFIDPFLLFHSKKIEYQKLHQEIIYYLKFLKSKASQDSIDSGLLKEWFYFSEVPNNWFGFSQDTNRGRGLAKDFADALSKRLYIIFNNFGEEKVTTGSHLEKLCLIKEGIGRDSISDFVVNLIKAFLLQQTEQFTKKYVGKSLAGTFGIKRVRFNYHTESWEDDRFYLPRYKDDYIMLTPRDILTKENGWINRRDLIEQFDKIPDTIPNEVLRSKINNYFFKELKLEPDKEPTKEQIHEAANATIIQFPETIDYFIKYKENNGEDAVVISKNKVEKSEILYHKNFAQIVELLAQKTSFYNIQPGTESEVKERLDFFKRVIEKEGGWNLLYLNGIPIRKEEDLHVLFRFVWFNTPSDLTQESKIGEGRVDYKASKGRRDKTLIEFKLASSTHLKKNLEKQLEAYKDLEQTPNGYMVVIFFTEKQELTVKRIIQDLKLDEDKVCLIDARRDNKVSPSNLR